MKMLTKYIGGGWQDRPQPEVAVLNLKKGNPFTRVLLSLPVSGVLPVKKLVIMQAKKWSQST